MRRVATRSRRAGAALALALACALSPGCSPAPEPEVAEETAPSEEPPVAPPRFRMVAGLRVEELGDGALLVSGFANGNVLAVAAADSSLVLIDAQSAERAEQLEEALRGSGLTGPVRTVVNTHYHTDHVGGNPRFRAAGATLVAHPSVAAEMLRDTFIVERDWQRTPEPPEAHPTRTVADSAVLELAGEAIVVRHLPRAHTGGDLAVWLPERGLLHMGDIVEIDARPFVDWWAGGTLAGMVEAVRWALEVTGPDDRIVPGHGPLIGRARLERYLTALEETAARCAQGRGLGCAPPR